MDDYAIGGESDVDPEEELSDGAEDYDESASESDDDSPLKTVDDVASFARASHANVRPMHVLPPADRRTPAVLSQYETAQVVALMADYIARHGTALPPSETEQFTKTNFCRLAAIREIQLGLCPFKIRRTVGTLPNGEKIVDEYALHEMVKLHLGF